MLPADDHQAAADRAAGSDSEPEGRRQSKRLTPGSRLSIERSPTVSQRELPEELAAADRLVGLVADFLYDWEESGESPTKAATRLLLRIAGIKFFDQAMSEIHERFNQGLDLPTLLK